MPRYEYKDAKSAKFWEIRLEGDSFTTRFGRIGSDGQTSTKVYPSADKAASEYEKVIAKKVKKGYAEVAGAVAGPAPKAGENPELEAAIHAAPEDAEAWSVFGDWLQEQEDPRGELIALAPSIADDEAKAKRYQEIVLAGMDGWLGKNVVKAVKAMQEESGDSAENILKVEWRDGFIKTAWISDTYDTEMGSTSKILRALLASSSGRFIQELTLGLWQWEENHYAGGVQALVKGGKRPSLRTLFIGDFDQEQSEISWSEIGDVSKVYPIAPNLTSLKLHGAEIGLGALKHAKLERLTLETGGLPAAALKSLGKADLPELTWLEAWLGVPDYGGNATVGDMAGLLSGKVCPKLEHLGLMNAQIQNDVVEAVAVSELLGRLRSVSFSMGCMTDPGAQHILDHQARFEHLTKIDVSDNFLSVEMLGKLQSAFGDRIEAGTQKGADTYGDEIYYYTTISE